jgi:hypothetical protein
VARSGASDRHDAVSEDESRSHSRPARIIASHLPVTFWRPALGVYEVVAPIGERTERSNLRV